MPLETKWQTPLGTNAINKICCVSVMAFGDVVKLGLSKAKSI